MKQTAFVLILSLLSSFSTTFAQGNVSYSLQVIDQEKKPQAGINIIAVETSKLTQTKGITDKNGTVQLNLKNGKEWAITIGEIDKAKYIVGVPMAEIEAGEIFVYDPSSIKRKKEQTTGRKDFTIKKIDSNINETTTFPNDQCMVILKLARTNGTPLSLVDISLVDTKNKICYEQSTNASGKACFIVPNNTKYDIDISAFLNYAYVDFTNETKIITVNVEFEPSIVTESFKNDTITQKFEKTPQPSSDRALIKVIVNGGTLQGINEWVYARDIHSGKVYAAKTDKTQTAFFLLPIGNIYVVDFKFEKSADGIDLSKAGEMTNGLLNIFYTPDPRLEFPEKFIPTPDRLFLNDFQTYLTKQFDRPTKGPIALTFDPSRNINKNSKEALFKITLTSSPNYVKAMRVPINIALVIDQSGSMFDEKRYEYLKTALKNIIPAINSKDMVSIILFNDQGTRVQNATMNSVQLLQFVADNYVPGGGTNILKGLQLGFESVLENLDENKINKVILLTDGYDSNPPTDITNFVSEKYSQGVECSTIGLGTSFNQALLELIATNGHGTFKFIKESDALSNSFLEEMESSISYVAKDIEIEVEHDASLIFSELYGYPVQDINSTGFKVKISKISQDKNEIAFLKFKLENPDKSIESKPITIKVSYFDMLLQKRISYEEKVNLTWTEETNTALKLDEEEKKLYAIAILNQTLKLMAESIEKKDNKNAKIALLSGIEQMKDIFPTTKPSEVLALFEQAESYVKLLEQAALNK